MMPFLASSGDPHTPPLDALESCPNPARRHAHHRLTPDSQGRRPRRTRPGPPPLALGGVPPPRRRRPPHQRVEARQPLPPLRPPPGPRPRPAVPRPRRPPGRGVGRLGGVGG